MIVYGPATHSNCGKFLRASDTNRSMKMLRGGGNDHRYGKNSEDWIIRSQAPKRLVQWVKDPLKSLYGF